MNPIIVVVLGILALGVVIATAIRFWRKRK